MNIYDELTIPAEEKTISPLSWRAVTHFCMQILFPVMPEQYIFTYYADNPYKMLPALRSLSRPAGETHLCTLNGRPFVCIPINLTHADGRTVSLYRMESGKKINSRLVCEVVLIAPEHLRHTAGGLIYNGDIICLEFADYPVILCPKAVSAQQPTLIEALFAMGDTLPEASALGASLLMTYWYALQSVGRDPVLDEACWSVGQLIQLQALLQTTVFPLKPTIRALLQEHLEGFAEVMLNNSAHASNMNFIASSYLKMLASGDTVHIEHVTGNMPDDLRDNFFRSLRALN